MASSIPHLSFSLLLFCLLVTQSMVMSCAEKNSTSFVRTSCSQTLYPDLCYASLAPFADKIGHDTVMLARFAMNVTIKSLKPLSLYIDSVLKPNTSDPITSSDVGALKDCKELISDATDHVKKSEKEVTELEMMVGSEVAWRIGNARTWLSAAITNENTCLDGFSEGNEGTKGDVEQEVRSRGTKAKQLTSISLAFVSSLVNP